MSRVIRHEDLALNAEEKTKKMLHYLNGSMNSQIKNYLTKHTVASQKYDIIFLIVIV